MDMISFARNRRGRGPRHGDAVLCRGRRPHDAPLRRALEELEFFFKEAFHPERLPGPRAPGDAKRGGGVASKSPE